MKYFLIILSVLSTLFYIGYFLSIEPLEKKESEKKIEREKNQEKKSRKKYISPKKRKFFSLVVPAIEKVHKEQWKQYLQIKQDLRDKISSLKISNLKKLYRVTGNDELLLALKPHPQSIVIAQAAIESAWGTSRFFVQANNIFGMWSKNANEPRIAASVKRNGTQTIWLKKFSTLDESIRQYYQTIGRVKEYQSFRKLRYKTQDVTQLVKKLDKYSELGQEYTKIILNVIKHNNLTKYDTNSMNKDEQ